MDKRSTFTALGTLPLTFWAVLALSALGFAVLWWWVNGHPRSARARVLNRLLATCGPAGSAVEQAALDDLRVAPLAARQALYRRPWLLFVGDAAADAPGLLAAAAHPERRPSVLDVENLAQSFWTWHALPGLTAINLHPHAVEAPDAAPTRRLWCQALLALAQVRSSLPLNGIVVCVGASPLLQDAPAMGREGARLRRLVDEAASHLGLVLPVYLCVTGLDRLSGYESVRAALGRDTLSQALGFCMPENENSRPDAPLLAAEAFASIAQRLRALRMGLLRASATPAERLAAQRFVQEVLDTEAGLQAFATGLFGPPSTGEVPRLFWRGLYFTGAGRSGSAFVADLFRRFLPADQPLARSRG